VLDLGQDPALAQESSRRPGVPSLQELDGYISPSMFVANKPFYQAFGRRAGVPISNAQEANELFARMDE
jgi:hypothetical protein